MIHTRLWTFCAMCKADFWITQILKLLRQSAFLKLAPLLAGITDTWPHPTHSLCCAECTTAKKMRVNCQHTNNPNLQIFPSSVIFLAPYAFLLVFVSLVQIRNSLVQQVFLCFHSTHSYYPLKITIVYSTYVMISKVLLKICGVCLLGHLTLPALLFVPK